MPFGGESFPDASLDPELVAAALESPMPFGGESFPDAKGNGKLPFYCFVTNAFRRGVLSGREHLCEQRVRHGAVTNAFRRGVLSGPLMEHGRMPWTSSCHQCLSAGSPFRTGEWIIANPASLATSPMPFGGESFPDPLGR